MLRRLILTGRFVSLSTPLRKFANVSDNRLLTRAARIGAATVRERLLLNTWSYLRSGVLSLCVAAAAFGAETRVTFLRDVAPILNKVGCTSGTCHGAAKGKNGFKLSLRGYDPQFDYEALLYDLSGRRFNRADPGKSLMLAKPTQEIAHGGGQRFDEGFRLLQDHLRLDRAGRSVRRSRPRTPSPTCGWNRKRSILPKPGENVTAKVIAQFKDGQTRDVTREAIIESNTPDVAKVGVVRRREGRAHRRGHAAGPLSGQVRHPAGDRAESQARLRLESAAAAQLHRPEDRRQAAAPEDSAVAGRGRRNLSAARLARSDRPDRRRRKPCRRFSPIPRLRARSARS